MKKVKLIDICNPKQWKTISISDLKDNGFPVYGANGIIGYYDKYTHKEPTILITCRGATCGTINISTPKSYVNGNAMALDNLSENANINFVAYSLISRGLKDVISGSAQPQITREGLSKITIPLPPLPQQRAIAEQLDKAQELVQYNEQLIEKYDELQQSLFLDMFGDPVVNEKGWEMVKFAKACEKILGGGTPSKAKPEYYIGSIPWISPKDMKTSIITKGEDFINENALKNSSVKIIPKNSLLMVIRSGILKHTLPVAINVEELTINQDMKAFVPKTNITNVIFMKYFFHSVSPFVLSKVRAVTADNIKFDDIKDLDYILPPLSLQTEFASHIESIELQKEQAKEALAKSKDIFQGLLQGYFM